MASRQYEKALEQFCIASAYFRAVTTSFRDRSVDTDYFLQARKDFAIAQKTMDHAEALEIKDKP